MVKKFDTNPLDPDFPEKVKERETQVLDGGENPTSGFTAPVTVVEEETRPLHGLNEFPVDQANPADLPAVVEDEDGNRRHSIGSVSIPENVLLALPYIPISFIGIIAGIIELIFVPRSEPRVRFHAAQGVAAHVAIFLISALLGFLSIFTDAADIAESIFGVVTFIVLLVFVFKAYQGKPIHIEAVESLTDWIEEKINPQKK